MMQGLYIGASGMKTHAEGMQIVSNNLANVSTVGYKQQLMLFEDMMYQELSLGSSSEIVNSSKGLGSRLGDVRTLHTPGSFEPGNAITDLAITEKGFFQINNEEGDSYYTRAGNFRFDDLGVLRSANGLTVSGIKIVNGKEVDGLTPVNINFNDVAVATDPARATTTMTALMNLNVTNDKLTDPTDPYFALAKAWNGTATPPVGKTDYSQPLSIFDAEGNQQEATIRFDSAPTVNGRRVMEFIVTIPPKKDGSAAAGTVGAGLLMAGTLTFSSNGELLNMSAFTPNGGDTTNLANWNQAALVNGVPQLTATFAGQPVQNIALNMGVTGDGSWNQATTPAGIGTTFSNIPGMSSPQYGASRTSAWPTSSALLNYTQDGYTVGDLNDLHVDDSGTVTAIYSNGQSHDLFRIPVFRFTSEDGLRREGNNMYSATKDSGQMEYGTAGTENYGKIAANTLETSNVDMAREMTTMIIVQRGFQSNSKSVTTLDTMIQKALELKRQ